MTYETPVADILHTMTHVVGEAESGAAEIADGTMEAIIGEAGRFAEAVLLPLDRVGDREGLRFDAGAVTTAPGWCEAYRRWTEAGWNGLTAPQGFGGQGLSQLTHAAVQEIWHGANLAFALCPLLTAGAIEALATHASPELQRLYLPKLVSGEWSGTMNLTEPQAGSDLGALRCRAEPAPDGSYRITGEKIFISYGEHDLTQNIVHLVLARLPDAAPGSRGISLFLVPKYLLQQDGTPGVRNAVACAGIERKLGMHAAPTCTMVYDGATGFLVGEAERGLNAMFTMMNRARLAVGLEGVGSAERATQTAIAFAHERRQGRAPGQAGGAPSPIVAHPDVARMCLTMRAMTAAARALCYLTARALDEAEDPKGAPETRRDAAERAALLTPVAKAFATDIANEVASLNIQVHGGMGFIEDSGAAQVARDIRIAAIYEGTNGIQAIDLVTRKISSLGGQAFEREMATMRRVSERLAASNGPALGRSAARLGDAIAALDRATTFLRETLASDPTRALAGATPYLRLFGLARGGAALANGALSAGSDERIAILRFFAEQLLPEAPALADTVTTGGEDVAGWAEALRLM
ncbi:MAG TPA: acyl-CoA dehydrogenase [Lichenihabitans sp.]|jgi:butyryl-CoA dehydrogenase|nr:acyl-CoA dehydrogenase [Lichenihabitans sp.]